MKRAAAILLLMLGCVVGQAALFSWTIVWNAPTNQPVLAYYAPGTNEGYKLYGTGVLGTPTNQFALLAVWTNWTVGTNAGGAVFFSSQVQVAQDPFFFEMTATNVHGESFFSDVALTGPPLEVPLISLHP